MMWVAEDSMSWRELDASAQWVCHGNHAGAWVLTGFRAAHRYGYVPLGDVRRRGVVARHRVTKS